MTDCAAPRHPDDDRPETEAHACLCRPCRLGLLHDLRRLPGLHNDLAYLPPTGEGDGDGPPFNEHAADCRSQIRHDLTYWAAHITQLRGADAPPVMDDGWSSRPVYVLAGWLAGQVTWCSFRDWAPDMAGAIASDRSRAQALLNPFVRRQFDIPGPDGICLNCPARVCVTVYASEGDRRWSFIGCPGCGGRWDSEQWMSYGHRVIRRRELIVTGKMKAPSATVESLLGTQPNEGGLND